MLQYVVHKTVFPIRPFFVATPWRFAHSFPHCALGQVLNLALIDPIIEEVDTVLVGETLDAMNTPHQHRGYKRGADEMPSPLRGFSSTPSKLPRTASPQIDWRSDVIEESKGFMASLDDPTLKRRLQNLVAGTYVNLPITPFIGLTSRFTNVEEEDTIPVLQRNVFTRLQAFVQAKEGVTYVHGPQGFGKSFALYHLFCSLSSYPDNRVLYISDCTSLNASSYFRMFRAIAAAFAKDEKFLAQIYPLALSFCDDSWLELLLHIKRYCDDHQPNRLTFYAIFDQHNGLNEEKRKEPPTNLLQWPTDLNGSNFKIIISASANNEDQPFTKDPDCLFEFMERFTEAELAAWRVKYSFFPNEPNLDSLVEMTGSIPLEIRKVLERRDELKIAANANGAEEPTLAQVLASYSTSRAKEINESHDKFVEENVSERESKRYKVSLFYMANNLPMDIEFDSVIDRQLCFETPDPNEPGRMLIKAICPLVHSTLSQRVDFEDLLRVVFRSAVPE